MQIYEGSIKAGTSRYPRYAKVVEMDFLDYFRCSPSESAAIITDKVELMALLNIMRCSFDLFIGVTDIFYS
jgi:hypothetical protein